MKKGAVLFIFLLILFSISFFSTRINAQTTPTSSTSMISALPNTDKNYYSCNSDNDCEKFPERKFCHTEYKKCVPCIKDEQCISKYGIKYPRCEDNPTEKETSCKTCTGWGKNNVCNLTNPKYPFCIDLTRSNPDSIPYCAECISSYDCTDPDKPSCKTVKDFKYNNDITLTTNICAKCDIDKDCPSNRICINGKCERRYCNELNEKGEVLIHPSKQCDKMDKNYYCFDLINRIFIGYPNPDIPQINLLKCDINNEINKQEADKKEFGKLCIDSAGNKHENSICIQMSDVCALDCCIGGVTNIQSIVDETCVGPNAIFRTVIADGYMYDSYFTEDRKCTLYKNSQHYLAIPVGECKLCKYSNKKASIVNKELGSKCFLSDNKLGFCNANGYCNECNTALDCPEPCKNPSCEYKKEFGMNKCIYNGNTKINTPCTVAQTLFKGFCNGNGDCVECNSPIQCPGIPCKTAVCNNNKCSYEQSKDLINCPVTPVSAPETPPTPSSPDSSSGSDNSITPSSSSSSSIQCSPSNDLCESPYCKEYLNSKYKFLIDLLSWFSGNANTCKNCQEITSSDSTITIDTANAPANLVNTISTTSSDNPSSTPTEKKCESDNDCDAKAPICYSNKCVTCDYRVLIGIDEPQYFNTICGNYYSHKGRPICVNSKSDPKYGQCVECTLSYSKYLCKDNSKPVCIDNKCSKCSTNKDCEKIGKQFCETDGSCSGCHQDSDCPNTDPYCDPLTKSCVKQRIKDLSKNKNCYFQYDCDINNPQCYNGKCSPCDYQLKDNFNYCNMYDKKCNQIPNDPKQSQCVECVSSKDCPDIKKVCNNYICEKCQDDNDCSISLGNKYCIEGACKECRSNTECGEYSLRPYCNKLKECSSECDDNSQCPEDKPVCEASIGKCINCILDSDCKGTNKYCIKDAQNPEGKCAECLTNAHCTNKYDNDPSRKICSSNGICTRCGIDSDCKDSWPPFCNDGLCTYDCAGKDNAGNPLHNCVKDLGSVAMVFGGKCANIEGDTNRCVVDPFGFYKDLNAQ